MTTDVFVFVLCS